MGLFDKFLKKNTGSTPKKRKQQGERSDWYFRTRHADKYFAQWAKEFKVFDAIRYYQGKQWKGYDNEEYKPYVVNLVYATLKVKRPSLLFSKPAFHFTPKPSPDFSGFDYETAAKQCLIKEDALNNWVQDRRNHFAAECKAALIDAFFGFGILEGGYSADWITNPDAQKPAYDNVDDKDKVTTHPVELPENERVYTKRIPFTQFRVGSADHQLLERSNWCGYWEYVDRRDLENTEGYTYNRNEYSGARSSEMDDFEIPYGVSGTKEDFTEYLKLGNLVKVWKIWDFRSKTYLVWVEEQDCIIYEDDFDELPLKYLKFDENLNGFYPIPPVSQWLSPQDEVNEASEQLRVHRRRANRRYIVRDGVMSDVELVKLLNGPDGTYVFTQDGAPAETAIFPVPVAQLDPANDQAFVRSKDNFNVVSLTSAELRGESDRVTATAATITSQQAQITESEPKDQVAMWLCDVGELVLSKLAITIIPFWIKRSLQNPQLGTSTSQQPQFTKVSGQDLEGDDHEINVEIASLSPIDNAAQLQKFLQFVGLLNQYPEFALSPLIIRELASQCDYTNEKTIEEFQKMATLKLMGLQQGNGQMGGDPNQQGGAGQQSAPQNMQQNQGGASPTAIQTQLQGQN